jgi:hypothetical protein
MNNTVPIEYGEFVGQPVEVPAMRVAGVPQAVITDEQLQAKAELWHDAETLSGPDCDHRQLEIIAFKAGYRAALAASPAAPATQPEAEKADAVDAKSRPFGCALAMGVLQSDLYRQLDDVQRAECDELVRRNLEWFKADAAIASQEKQQ